MRFDRLRAKWLEALLVVVTCIHLSLIVPRSWRYLVDDSYITFRYAQNYAVGHFDFNRHQPREYWVEGNTSFLWTLALVPFAWVRFPLPLAAQILGLGCWIGLIALARRLALKRLGRGGAVAAFLVANGFPFIFYSTSGMDSMAYAFLVLAFADALINAPNSRNARSALVLAGLSICVVWVRPEGIAVVLASLAAAWLAARRGARTLLAAAGAAVAAQAGLLALRLTLYGKPFPNTFYAKYGGAMTTSPAESEAWRKIWIYFQKIAGFHQAQFLADAPCVLAPWALLGLVAAVMALSRRRGGGGEDERSHDRFRAALTLLSVCLIALVPAVYFQPDILWLERFSFPSFALLLVFLGAGIARLCEVRGRLVRAALLVLSTAFLLIYSYSNFDRGKYFLDRFEDSWFQSNRHRALGELLRREFPETQLLAFSEMGAVPFYSRFEAVDMLGLCDPTTAHFMTTRDYVGIASYVVLRCPDLIVLVCDRIDDPTSAEAFQHPLIRSFIDLPAFQQAYTPAIRFRRAKKDGWIVYRRRE
ncbi:hypothetical protein JW916_14190 [Candidatus Sumerlaeota bacterium]|nr:hypothetical protein [Candidatus Sumerlaeota bacterium]